MRLLILYMIRTRTMAFLTTDGENSLRSVKFFRLFPGRRYYFGKCCMTFQAARCDRPVKNNSVGKSGAVRPLISGAEITDRKLKQAVLHPVHIRLAIISGTNSDVKFSRLGFFT